MTVRVNGFDVECEKFGFPMSDDKGEGGVGTKDIPKNVAEEGKECSEDVKTKEKESNDDHTNFLVLVRDCYNMQSGLCFSHSSFITNNFQFTINVHTFSYVLTTLL